MKTFSVVPDANETSWYVKLEDVAPEEVYGSKDDALSAAEQMAKENTPSKVEIRDKDDNIQEEKRF
ncbi:hypothetical protein J18TS1_18690 [Oceanobacillus oncorhynchi subsp. incaldanensis]|uniref:DUF2188 domain-containing protein n=2 Tax=Oceanobacillus TaxID=182709 RepID=A0A0A1MRP1_9BACI|nr:DUF2188 domain-containing protein [Oceanobacillus oncorhynchi]MDM8100283.1 DUF2188 domain-containing protein [Oceanobacillus oncorhynchi]UUI40902.1 DUF2188 domain-containing protein [Oceanobacillus oncorhynchi]GIO18769.1 hypothetical protein J18TS1_18690 [Oceanobacillus oncorhynchi subsp. incaldanensis]CEI82344.1 hypothetical protein BN997_02207 [Oceanobacillus oncorhynchi]